MIKGNESDVGNIDFEMQAQILMFYILFDLHRIVHISAARCPMEMRFGSKCSILNEKVIDIKN